MPTRTAAAPTKLCRIATSSGMEVIATRMASSAPITHPIPSAPASTPTTVLSGVTVALSPPGSNSATAVMRTATSMPTMPNRFPCRALSCVDRPRKLRMNSRLAAR